MGSAGLDEEGGLVVEEGLDTAATLRPPALLVEPIAWASGNWLVVMGRLLHDERDFELLESMVAYLLGVTETDVATMRRVLSSRLSVPDVERAMSTAQKLHQQGVEEGLQKGLQEGLQKGRAAIVARQLTFRFGALSEAVQARLAAATVDELDRFAERILGASRIEDLLGE